MSASVWNNAGTWEEKDCSEWAKEQLQTGLAVEAGTARVTNVTNVKGHVHVLHVRGKARVGMELTFELGIEVTSDAGEAVPGKLSVTEMSETDVDDYDLELSGRVKSEGTKAQQAANKAQALGLREPLTAAIRAMMAAAIERAGSA
eukprot:m.140013 g.140013  ORF g.140013 m.140013 type:complete len:146 (-) comp14026_c1_seq3:4219-4656(-)